MEILSTIVYVFCAGLPKIPKKTLKAFVFIKGFADTIGLSKIDGNAYFYRLYFFMLTT